MRQARGEARRNGVRWVVGHAVGLKIGNVLGQSNCMEAILLTTQEGVELYCRWRVARFIVGQVTSNGTVIRYRETL